MHGCHECEKLTRRSFLLRSGAGAGAFALANPLMEFIARSYGATTGGTGNFLVLCELHGGLDALSFLVPRTNNAYYNRRPTLAIPAGQTMAIAGNPAYGINNQFPVFQSLYSAGQVAIVQQVGYPNPNGSHFESQEIFEYGMRNIGSRGTNGSWYERLRQTYFDQPYGVLSSSVVGDPTRFGYPDRNFYNAAANAFGRLAQYRSGGNDLQRELFDRYRRLDELGDELRSRTEGFSSSGAARGEFFRAAQYAAANLGTQIIKIKYAGFDTHANQAETNAVLFAQVNDEFQQFVSDMQALDLWNRATVLFYTEFGRRNAENASPGTDHGHGSHMILVGPRVNGGLHGQAVTTSDLNQLSLPYYVDFRAVFGTAIRDWLGFDPAPIFNLSGESYNANVGSALFS